MDTLDQETPPAPKPPTRGGIGPVLGIIVIVILIALGGLYYVTKEVSQVNYGATSAP